MSNDETPTLASVARTRQTRAPKGPSYDLDDLQQQYPSLKYLAAPATKASQRAWVAAFTHRPEALEGILSDLIKQAYAKPGRIGQRPMPKEEEVNLEALLQGEYTEEAIHVALPKLVKISQVAFCAKVHISRRMYQRMMLPDSDADKYHPDMEMIQRIAAAVGKPPSYFLEYRLIAAQAAFLKLIQDRPVVATRIYREYLEVNRQSPLVK
jgi:transcriptional regulator with XRE-family HTH domain